MRDFNLCAARMMWAMNICLDARRYYLTGALIEPVDDGALIVASDGRVMLVQHDRQALAPRRAILRVQPTVPPVGDDDADPHGGWHWHGARLLVPSDVAEGTRAAAVIWTGTVPGTHVIADEPATVESYPDWRRAWRAAQSGEEGPLAGGLDPRLLATLAGDKSALRIVSRGSVEPYIISFPDDPDALGLLTPCSTLPDDDERRADMLARAGLTPNA